MSDDEGLRMPPGSLPRRRLTRQMRMLFVATIVVGAVEALGLIVFMGWW